MSSKQVYALHIPTGRQELLAALQFSPTCIASGYGWICLGGYDHGTVAFLDISKCWLFGLPSISSSAEVDDLLPLDLDPHPQYLSQSQTRLNEPNPQRPSPIITRKAIGSAIVNGITVSRFVDSGCDIPNDTVAVLSNNDGTVTIYSLSRQATLKRINLTKEINHASISPDGELLIAVGDINDVWIFKRWTRKRLSGQHYYDWQELATIELVSTVINDWCFSTAWSPSGHMCMVASQFGVLTVFETSKIKKGMDHTDAIIHSLRSSRPVVCEPTVFIPSAPRSMAFSPRPWDLVAWAEDHGRITVADLRDGFDSRQTIEVDVTADNVERIPIIPIKSDIVFGAGDQGVDDMVVQRALQSNDPDTALQQAVQYLEDAAARRRSLSTTVYASEQEPNQSVLADSEQGSIESTEPRSGDAESSTPYSINYSDRDSGVMGSPRPQPLTLGEHMISRTDVRHMPPSWSPPRRRSSLVMSPYSVEGPDRDLRRAYHGPTRLAQFPFSTSPSRLSEGTFDASGDSRGPISMLHRGPIPQPYHPDSASARPVLQPPTIDDHRPIRQRLPTDIPQPLPGEARDRVAEAMLRLNYPVSGTRDPIQTDRLLREQARTWGRRINELRERAGQLGVGNIGPAGTPDLSFLEEANDIVLGRETISRARTTQRTSSDGEISIQGIGWSWDGRYL